MQCPNCGKEALNVNGRYVCLDCGVEISPQSTATPTVALTGDQNTIVNHSEPEVSVPAETEGTPALEVPEATVPTAEQVPENTSPDAEPMETTTAAPVKINPAPVETEFLKELNTEPEASLPSGSAAGAVPDFPVSNAFPAEPIAQPEATPAQAPTFNVPEPQVVPPEAPENYFQPATVSLGGSMPVQEEVQPTVEAPVVTPEPFGQNQTEVVPQADAVNIPITQPATEVPLPENNFSATEGMPSSSTVNSTPSMPAPEVHAPENLTPGPEQFNPTTTVEPPVSEPAPVGGSSLDALLNQYSTPATQAPVEPVTNPVSAPSFDSVMPSSEPNPLSPAEAMAKAGGSIPGAGNIPSAESVFGPQAQAQSLDVPQKSGADTKKLILWAVIGVLGVLLLAGAVYLVVALTKPKATTDPAAAKQEEMLKYSDLVGKAMDPNQNVAVGFSQILDFSGATVKTAEGADQLATKALETLFATPVENKGSWSADATGNISLDATTSGTVNKRIYIGTDKSTYIFNGGKWDKTSDYQFASIPSLYGAVNKGALFYTSKSDEINYVNDEELNGTTYHKIQIKPKKEVFEALIAGANTTIAAAKIDSVQSDNIEIFAWITDEGKIYKVTAIGDLGISSDLFEGTVSVNSEATYEYKDVTISKP